MKNKKRNARWSLMMITVFLIGSVNAAVLHYDGLQQPYNDVDKMAILSSEMNTFTNLRKQNPCRYQQSSNFDGGTNNQIVSATGNDGKGYGKYLAGGAAGGAAVGAAVGSVVPVLGTALGALGGAILGSGVAYYWS
ncbi:uncharacterized protein LOC108739744 [Agrilus planipennis]|uniref:Uncharacterized protein LOC108739744 n=1 Tax=Agrilus planipennis TaxID=224129 RepID=A0A1W4XA56_AGRPL|nr:uncharacterized protein LOC108739744 [Agrilus planipennis]XP_018329296.1 uncharacterized protein LOC108739744 [Agrilus planipennis]